MENSDKRTENQQVNAAAQEENPQQEDSRVTENGTPHSDTEEFNGAPPAEVELIDYVTEIADLRRDLETMQEKLLRQAAEYQNYRRRTEQEKATLIDLGKSIVLQGIFEVVDDLERTIEAADKVDSEQSDETYRALKNGVTLVYRKLMDTLSRLGVEPIEAVGKEFHVDEHEAMMQQPAPDGVEPGTVLSEFQKGYRMGDRVLRHSKVVVSV